MNLIQKLFFFLLLVSEFSVLAQSNVKLNSPDGKLVFLFKLTQKAPVYQVTYKGKTFIKDSELSLAFIKKGQFGANLKMLKAQLKQIDECYDLPVGKVKTVRDQHREVVIPLVEQSGLKRQVNLAVWVFNDGVAFRYEFPKQINWSSYVLTDENSQFNITGCRRS